MAEIDAALVAVDVDLPGAEAVIDLLAGLLHAHGAVSASYGAATLERERKHPTGLPTRPFCIAFPHADADGVNRSALAVASLRRPVVFQSMEDPEESLPVELVFMLANNSPEDQVQALRNLSLVFGQPGKLTELRALASPAEVARWLRQELDGAGDTDPSAGRP